MVKQPLRSPEAGAGSIMTIASISAHQASRGQYTSDYCMSKGAVLSLIKQLGVEIAEYGIRVNCISPGYISTGLTASLVNKRPKLGEIFTTEPPMKRMGRRSDLKGATVFLLSDASSYMTSSEILISGGMHAGRL
ncbi:NADP-dependent mannitol dehydrogenase [Colletotrichum liriopes]|uniref:NADP-dependent mannitol dehydrogenase n=1 Tax=Colletotrichum liriopes TaxID=708192 RepID=A0AA37GWF3_9PEZI|nr:NADP-dependent mannitol dehydrogenase [Colletotrichum liriopes]